MGVKQKNEKIIQLSYLTKKKRLCDQKTEGRKHIKSVYVSKLSFYRLASWSIELWSDNVLGTSSLNVTFSFGELGQ